MDVRNLFRMNSIRKKILTGSSVFVLTLVVFYSLNNYSREGDLRYFIIRSSYSEEISRLFTEFNTSLGNKRVLINSLKEMIELTSNSGKSISNASEEILSESKSQSQEMQKVAESSRNQT